MLSRPKSPVRVPVFLSDWASRLRFSDWLSVFNRSSRCIALLKELQDGKRSVFAFHLVLEPALSLRDGCDGSVRAERAERTRKVRGIHVDQGACSALAELVQAHTGQFLQSSKGLFFQARLTSLAYRTGYDDVDELVTYLVDQKPGSNMELQVVTALLDRRSRFMSERNELRALFETAISPGILRAEPGRYRIWCAGCGSGQEAYSLLMFLKNQVPPTRLETVDIVATDISGEVLLNANSGIYSHFDVQMGLSASNLVKYFTRLEDGDWQVSSDLVRRISFRSHNLLSFSPSLGKFDLVVCRNVLGSMTAGHRETALRTLEDHLRPGAYLLVQN